MTPHRKLRDLFWLVIPWSAFWFGLGGWQWKWLRRWFLPISNAVLARAYGLPWWRCVAYALSTIGVFCLAYSPERATWVWIALVGAGMGATPLFLMRWHLLHLFCPVTTSVIFCGLMAVSLHDNNFAWMWCQMLMGGLHGLWVSEAIREWEHDAPG